MCELLDAEFSNASVAAANRWMAGNWHLFFGNDADRAMTLSTEAVELDPSCAMTHLLSAIGALLTGKPDQALVAAGPAEGLTRDAGEHRYFLMVLGNAHLLAGDVGEATRVADAFVAWAEDRQFPTAMGMAYHLKGRTLAEQDAAAARESFERGLGVIREQIPECWLVEINLKREMIPLAFRMDSSDAIELAVAVLRESVRHNETGNLLSSFAYAAIMLADDSLDEIAATAIGAAGPMLLAPRDSAIYEQTKMSLEGRLGQRYEALVTEGARMPVMSTAQNVIDALSSLRPHATS